MTAKEKKDYLTKDGITFNSPEEMEAYVQDLATNGFLKEAVKGDEILIKSVCCANAAGALPSIVAECLDLPVKQVNEILLDHKPSLKLMCSKMDTKYQRHRIKNTVDAAMSKLEEEIQRGTGKASVDATREMLNMIKTGKLEDLLEGNKQNKDFSDIPDDVAQLELIEAQLEAELGLN